MLERMWFQITLYAVAVLSVFAATVLTQLFQPLLSSLSFTFFYAAIAISAWYGGMKPGLLATVLFILSVSYFFLDPIHSLAIADQGNFIRLSLSALVAFLISYLISELRNAKYQIERLNNRRLQESKEQLQLAMQAAEMGMWNWNIVTGEITWTSEHEKLFGLVPGTFDGRYETFYARMHPDDRQGLNQAVQKAILEHSIYEHEYRIIWTDGSVHWVEGRGQTFYNEIGQPVRMTGTIINIDERKRTETALMQSEQKLRAIFETEPECVKVITTDGILQNMNPAGLAMIEADNLDQVFGQCIYPLIEPTQQQAFLEFIQKVAQGEAGAFEFEITGLKGTRRWLESRAVPLLIPDEVVPYVLAVTRDITERKQTEIQIRQLNAELEQRMAERTVELQRSNDFLNSFFNGASLAAIGLCIHDREMRFVQINESLANINGCSVEAHLGKTTTEILPELASSINPLLEQVLITGQPILNLEIVAPVPSQVGVMRYWLASYFPIIGSSSSTQIVGVGVIVIEISDRKRSEMALFKSEQKFRAIFEQTFQFIGLLTVDGTLLEINQAPLDFAHIKREAVIGRPLWEFPSWAASAQTQEIAKTAIAQAASGKFYRSEITVQSSDGSYATFDFSVKPVLDEASQIELLIAEGRDISDRKQAEAILQESDRRWHSLLNNVELIVVGLDQNGNVDYINPFFLQLTGYTPEEVLGKYWFDYFLPQSQKYPVRVCFEEVLEKNFHSHYQNSIVTKLGEERMIAWSNTLLRNAKGQPIGTISIGEDITERYKLERMKAEFISIVSHELRTPLTSISGALELLSTGLIQPESKRGQETLQIAATETDRLTRLVNDILDLERLEFGKIRLEYKSWNLAELMRRAVDFMQLAANQAGITLSVEVLSVILEIDGDRILQVLTNLLSNAIKFSPNNSTIWLTAKICKAEKQTEVQGTASSIGAVEFRHQNFSEQRDCANGGSKEGEHFYFRHPMAPSLDTLHYTPYILISVRDRGRGIPMNKLESIFERFQQVDASDSRKKGGTGLGLAICRNIMQQHGGHIWAESVLEQGSCFYFTLPLTAEH
ncbi:PAS domain S-box protein [Nostoc foliaceum]|uniref:histidine kinase n=3 Tax=Nostoc TaxID=1177 RepID=A0ABR8IJU7_9NOSO|nr:PAS domain S-box protein [Nostoc foliaceum]MBD2564961.1 PAS domain S-box protein [Nostoc linckia FACHB-391]MBD2651086.1 PAS domain S-box protein [Nostoc foliaceum FACHB-393]